MKVVIQSNKQNQLFYIECARVHIKLCEATFRKLCHCAMMSFDHLYI